MKQSHFGCGPSSHSLLGTRQPGRALTLAAPLVATGSVAQAPSAVAADAEPSQRHMRTCEGASCADAVATPTGVVADTAESRQCQALRRAAPSGCTNARGDVPTIDGIGRDVPSCANGPFAAAFASVVDELPISGLERNPDHPLPGISFYGVCLAHSACYQFVSDRHACDHEFSRQLGTLCLASDPESLNQCLRLAGAFGEIVDAWGQPVHNDMLRARDCAAWFKELEAHGCSTALDE